nr:hypothetical protein [Candidatus Ichthyocystis sparus]
MLISPEIIIGDKFLDVARCFLLGESFLCSRMSSISCFINFCHFPLSSVGLKTTSKGMLNLLHLSSDIGRIFCLIQYP